VLLLLQDVIVSEEFDALHKRLDEERGKQLRVIHGGVYYSSKHTVTRPPRSHDPLTAFDNDPMTKLKKYAQDKHLRLVDVFKYFDKDTSWKLDRAEFMRGIKVRHNVTAAASRCVTMLPSRRHQGASQCCRRGIKVRHNVAAAVSWCVTMLPPRRHQGV
jgi:hypothetical protein